MNNPLNTEPLAVVKVVKLILMAAVTFGLRLTEPQLASTLAALEGIAWLIERSQVTSPATLAAMAPKDLAKAQATPEPVKDIVQKLP